MDERNNQQNQSSPQRNGIPNTVSKGELFVGMNLLSKIGVIFIIVGVIAFSAVSEGYIPTAVRMGMVIAIGVIMLVGGEIFRRKGSIVFSNALTYGGVAELFVCTLIGRFGFEVWNGLTAQILGLAFAAVGLLLSVRYKSQPLLVVTLIFGTLPVFASNDSAFAVAVGALCLVALHAVSAFISRKNNYPVSTMVGIILSFIQCGMILTVQFDIALMYDVFDSNLIVGVFLLAFILSVTVCYAGGLLLNAAESEGHMSGMETAMLCLSMVSFLILMTTMLTAASGSARVGGIGDIVFAVVIAVITASFSLRFGKRCHVSTVLINAALASVTLAVPMILSYAALYTAWHIFAVAVMTLWLFTERKLFRNWGIVLLVLSEISFFAVLIAIGLRDMFGSPYSSDRVIAMIVNVVMWFVLLVMFIIRKKHENTGIRIYTCATFINAGILLCSLVNVDLGKALHDAGFDNAERSILVTLVCACVWLALGFAAGRPKYLGNVGMGFSVAFYAIGMCFLFGNNCIEWSANARDVKFGALFVVITVVVNLISVLTVLDLTLQITAKAPKFGKAVGLVVSGYALMSLTSVLGMNNMVAFTSWIISIIYIAMAAVWIVIGFKKLNALLRRFGLALALLSSAKLFLFDFRGIDAMGRTLLFIGFGFTLLAISFGYGIAEKKLKDQNGKRG